jgi:hypothetical protein
MNLRFEINTLEDAQLAARTCQNLVLAFGGDVQPLPAVTPRQRTRVESAGAPPGLPTDAPAFDRAAVESCVKAEAVSRGILWVRQNVFDKYNVKKCGELTDAQLIELAAHMKATEPDPK